MVLKLYNTLKRKKEKFVPINEKEVGIYSCGPTVYWYQHIGNMRGYFCWDILKRVLQFNGYKVKHVINVTDVGHLTSDADSGEDKMEKAAKKENKSAKEIAEMYFKVFKEDLKKLNIIEPSVWPKATEHIKEQINLIKTLEKKGMTYKTGDGIYYDTSKFKDYGKLGHTNIEGLEEGKRIAFAEKKNKTDFALWKFSEKKDKRQQEWESPWGVGFPGWHIECSAMSSKYLGKQFDIHTGGQEHIQIHHTNEITQSEGAFEKKPWVRYWMHNAWLLLKGEKMSKSKGRIFRLSELEEKGYSPMDLRYLFLGTHYRKPLNFSLEILDKAKDARERLKNILSETKNDEEINNKYLNEFIKAITDDMNTPVALQVLWKLVRDEKAKGKIRTVEQMDKVFGLDLLKFDNVKIPGAIRELAEKRENARMKKDWAKADTLRDELSKRGWIIEDKSDGFKLSKK